MSDDTAVVVLVVAADRALRTDLEDELNDVLVGLATVHAVGDADAALRAGRDAIERGGLVPVAFVEQDLRADGGVGALVALHADDVLATTRTVLVTGSASLRGVDAALQAGAVHGMVTRPWTREGLVALLDAQLATHLVEHAPDLLARFEPLLDDADLRSAERRIAQRRAVPPRASDAPHPLLDESSDDEALEAELVDAFDRALGHPPRIRIGPGTTMIESGEDVGGIFLVLDGVVRMSSTTDTGEVILHEQSTGAILGLLSLAQRRQAMLTCRAVTEVRAIPVTLDQLERALDAEPTLSGLLNRVLIGSLARRLRRSDELQVELDRSLAALSEARAQLVANAKFTTLGEMSAGLAHELNNPTAALLRSLDHLTGDLAELVDDDDAMATVSAHVDTDRIELSSAQRRSVRREIADALGDRRLAEQLVDLGATDVASARRLAALPADDRARRAAAIRVGATLRNADRAAHRVQSLVDSLRAYARGDDGRGLLVPDVDITRTIDSALRLVSHRIGEVAVERDDAELPPIRGRPGALQHVWTNLITNAIDALDGSGTIAIRTALVRPDTVRIEVTDDGPGVPEELLDRIFEPRFTTKHGRVEFGLGLGLSIARQIVGDHDGSIGVDSEPGRTTFTVDLPVGSTTNEPAEEPHG